MNGILKQLQLLGQIKEFEGNWFLLHNASYSLY